MKSSTSPCLPILALFQNSRQKKRILSHFVADVTRFVTQYIVVATVNRTAAQH
jgi:hypothetical protein